MKNIYTSVALSLRSITWLLVGLFWFSALIAEAQIFSPNTPVTTCIGGTVNFSTNITANVASYSWVFQGGTPGTSNIQNPSVIYNTPNGTPYNVSLTITFNNGNPAQTLSLPIVNVFSVQTPITLTNVTCNGGNNGTASLTITGSGNYNIVWFPTGPLNNPNATNLPARDYTVQITDLSSNCPTAVIPFTINEPSAITFTSTTTDITCFGLNNGTININNVNGGTPGYTFTWNDIGLGTANRTGLSAGNYICTITDAVGCTTVQLFTIIEPFDLQAIAEPQNITPVRCFGESNGKAILSVSGGTGTRTFNWSHPNGIADSIVNVPAGNYTVTVTDENNCQEIVLVTITEPNVLQMVIQNISNVSCNGFNDGSFSILIIGGTTSNGGYTYLWNGPGIITQPPLPQQLNGLQPGTYNLTVTDTLGCTGNFSITITEPQALSINLDNLQTPNCFGQSNGNLIVSVSGGVPPYSYSWSRNNIPNFSTNEDLSNIPGGDYLLTVIDSRNCSINRSFTVTEPLELFISLVQFTNPSCFNGADGDIRINVEGGTPPYFYQWNTGTSLEDRIPDLSAILSPTQNPYSVTVTDSRGCQTDTTVTLQNPPAITLTNTVITPPSCFGTNSGSIDITVSGGAIPYRFTWTNQGSNNEDLTNVPCGTYTLIIDDNNNCTFTQQFTIPCAGSFSLTATSNNIACFSANTGNINITPTGGRTPYTYNWTRDGNFFGATQNVTNLVAGVYCVTVTDFNSCTIDSCFTITQPTQLTAFMSDSTDITCFGAANGAATVTATGGTPPYRYSWTNGRTTASISGLSPGIYSVVVTDANNCRTSNPISVTITQPTRLTVALGSRTNVSCQNGNGGAISVVANGGTPFLRNTFPEYNYVWSDNNTINSPDRTGLTAGSYTVTVSDSMSCTASLNITITQPTSVITLSIPSKIDVQCNGRSTGRIDLRPTGGTPPYHFQWSNNATTEDLNSLPAGQYCVTVTDSRGCSSTACQVITEPTAVTVAIASFQNETCTGNRDGRIVLDVRGGTAPYFAIWSNGAQTRDLFNIPAGIYSVTVADSRGCQATIDQEITASAVIDVTLDSIRHVTCSGLSDGAIFTSVTGGTGVYTFHWTPVNLTTDDITNISAGTYVLTVRDNGGCVTTFTQTITAPQTLTISPQSVVNPACSGESTGSISTTIAGGTEPYTISWSHDPLLNTTNAEDLPVGCYDINVTDANGCTATRNFCLTQTATLQATVTVQAETCNNDGLSSLTANPSGGTPPYRYEWSNGATTQTTTNVAPGTYSLSVFDSLNCFIQVTDIVMPLTGRLIITERSKTDPTCLNASDGSVRVQILGGIQPYTYLWSTGSNQEDINGLTSGTYCLTVTDANGCVSDTCFILNPLPAITITADVLRLPACSGANDGAIDVSVQGGTAPYNYFWSHGPATEDVNGLAPGTYCLLVEDVNGCQNQVCFTLDREPNPTVQFQLTRTSFCQSEAPFVLHATPPGGIFTGSGVENDSIFNPALVSGNVVITYSGILNGCFYSGSTLIRVNPQPDSVGLFIGVSDTVSQFCADNTAPYNLVFAPVQPNTRIIFSGPGVRQVGPNAFQFVPSIAGIGTHTITGTIISTTTACSRINSREVTVVPPISVNLTADNTTICRGSTTILTATGADAYDWSPSTGLSCAPNCKNFIGTVVAAPTTTTTYTVVGKTGSCVNRQTVRIEVLQTPAIVVTASTNNVCAGSPVTLRASSAGAYTYTWSARGTFAGGVGSSVVINPLLTDTFFVTGQLENGCFRTASIIVKVLPITIIAEPDQGIICLGGSTVIRASATQQGIFNFTWSPSTGLNTNRGANVIASPKQTTTYTVTRSGTGNCRTTTVTVEVIDTTAKFTNTFASPYCNNGLATPITLTAEPPGGTFDGPGVTGNQFLPNIPGTYNLTYFGSNNGCPFSATQKVTVVNPKAPKIVNWVAEYCYIKSPVQLLLDVPGATISGIGMQPGNIFSPYQAGVGIHLLNITIPPGTPGCYTDTTYTVTVSRPDVQIQGLSDVYCGSVSPVTLTGIPAGGKFIGNGIRNGNQFVPPGVGTYTITYFGRDILCTYSLTRTVRVLPAITATATTTPVTDPFTPNGTITVSVSGGSGNYAYFIDGSPTPQLSPVFTNQNSGSHTIIVADVNTACTVTVTVNVPSNVNICNPPTNLTVNNITDNSAQVSWTAVSGALSYEVEYMPTGTTNLIRIPTTLTTVSLSNLLCGSDYDVVVRAVCGTNVISPNATTTFTTTEIGCPRNCDAPADITVSELTTNSFRLTWIGVPAALYYEFQFKKVGDPDPTPIQIFDTTTVIPNLDFNTRYTYLVRAICGTNRTSEWIGDTTQTLSPCTAPTNINVTIITASTATITWDAPVNALEYIVSWREVGLSSPFEEDTLSQTQLTITGLTPGFDYEFNIRSLCGALGESEGSPLDTFTTDILPECRQPRDLKFLSITKNSGLMVWSPVDQATTYEVEYQERGGTQQFTARTSRSAVALNGLKPATEYCWRVRAECGANNFSEFSRDTCFTTLPDITSCPAPSGIRISNVANTTATITWNAVQGATRYEVKYNIVGNTTIETRSVTSPSISLTGLLPGKTYEYTIKTICIGNLSSLVTQGPRFTTTGNAACPEPVNVRVDNITNLSAVVRWDGHTQAIQYEVEYNPVGGLSSLIITTGNTFANLTGLTPNTEYEVRVKAICGDNLTSGVVNAPIFRTSAQSGNCPVPTNLTITNVGITTISLLWNGHPTAMGYQVDYRVRGSNSEFTTVNTTNSSITITGLLPGVGYELILRSVCPGNVVSANTAPIFATTNNGSNCPTPINVRVVSTTSASAEITWTAVPNADFYRVSYRLKNSLNNPLTQNTTTNSITLSNLLGNEEYVFFVTTVCTSGENSLPSAEQIFKTVPNSDCPAPINVSYTNITDRSVLISWNNVVQAVQYEVNYRINGILRWNPPILVTDNFIVLDGLSSNTNYEFLIRTLCASSSSSEDNFVIQRFTTLPSLNCAMPTNLTVGQIQSNSAFLSWNAVPNVSSYEVAFRPREIFTFTVVPTNTNSITVGGLLPSTEYVWVVRSVCGTNERSTDVAGTKFTTPAGQSCGTPTITNIVPNTNSITLNWTPVSGATSYEISFRLEPNGTRNTVRNISPNVSTFTLTSLLPNSNYSIQMRAVCGSTLGDLSPTVIVTTIPLTPSCQTPTITRLTPTRNTVLVQWTAVPNVIGYTLQIRHPGQTITTIPVSNPNAVSFTITNLLADTEYEIRMAARCGTVNSLYSTFTRFRTLAGRLEEETNLNKVSSLMEWNVYPNPYRGQFTVRYEAVSAIPVQVVMTDALGRMVYTTTLHSVAGTNEWLIETPDVASGMYLVKLSAGDQSKVIKIVKE